MRSAETSMQKHLRAAKPNEPAIQSAQPSGKKWPIAANPRLGGHAVAADIGAGIRANDRY